MFPFQVSTAAPHSLFPPSNRALRIHFVGSAPLCTHTTGSFLHQQVLWKTQERFTQLSAAGEALKAAKPWVSRRRETVLMPQELLHLPVNFDEEARAAGETERRKWWGRREEKATVMTVITSRCGRLLGDGGNKMEADRKRREVNFFSWILKSRWNEKYLFNPFRSDHKSCFAPP